MKVKLANGTELTALGVRGGPVFYQGMERDCLTFIFDPAERGVEELDRLFTAENCESVTLADDGGSEFIHTGYTIRKSLEKGPEPGGGAPYGSVPPERIRIAMAQRTYLEQTQADLVDAVDALIISGLEV